MSDDHIPWCRPQDLKRTELIQVAAWLRSMDPDYYNLFGLNEQQIDSVIMDLLFRRESEFGTTILVRDTHALAGFATWFPGNELFPRRIFVLQSLLAAAPDLETCKDRLKTFEGARTPVAPGSLYLSKIYVNGTMRHTGVASRLLDRFIEEGQQMGRGLSLHVPRENTAAVALYRKHDFHLVPGKPDSRYFLMEKSLHKKVPNELP